MAELPIAPIKRIIKNVGAERVSEEAEIALAKDLEQNAEEICYSSG
jgi:histone H3/H4